MTKRLITIFLILVVSLSLMPTSALSVTDAADAAGKLNSLGLFLGVGTGAGGSADFALDRVSTRAEAVTMLVRLFGKEKEALNGAWTTPFSDVPDWARPYVGYAYANGLTYGIDNETFGSARDVIASEYITFVLRALGYTSGVDFESDSAWVLSDELGFTDGHYNTLTGVFRRGDIAEISFDALSVRHKDSEKTLCTSLIEAGAFTEEMASAVGLGDADSAVEAAQAPMGTATPGALEFERAVFLLINAEREKQGVNALLWDASLAAIARAYSADMEQRGYFSHTNPDGQDLADRLYSANISYHYFGESLARGHKTPEAVVNAWMNSPGHRNAILSSHAVYVGVGYQSNYWTVELIG